MPVSGCSRRWHTPHQVLQWLLQRPPLTANNWRRFSPDNRSAFFGNCGLAMMPSLRTKGWRNFRYLCRFLGHIPLRETTVPR